MKSGCKLPGWLELHEMALRLVSVVHFSNIVFVRPLKFLSFVLNKLLTWSTWWDISIKWFFHSHFNLALPTFLGTSKTLGLWPLIINKLFLPTRRHAWDVWVKSVAPNFSQMLKRTSMEFPDGSLRLVEFRGEETGSCSGVRIFHFGRLLVVPVRGGGWISFYLHIAIQSSH